ncbi:transmembrane protein, putative [Bodo saltans]|uniref:Transmembrane protein, putative n=1 Tax=Bodo saltans TaxID=75058 RepID=A0A0S4JN84_BODSA|nr:transmembrane protein, putative [Bodo saltans]|eukprot:CUG93001.1 transmembrane protein, putative [Bodo saltans]
MGNSLYRRLATHADATGATVGTIPMFDEDERAIGSRFDALPPTSSSAVAQHYQNAKAPHFRKSHRACGTEDDPTAPFFAVAQHQLLRHLNIIQFKFCLFTLCLWNYLSQIRFVFGQDDYPGSIPPAVYLHWMIDGTTGSSREANGGGMDGAYLPTFDKQWIGLLYLAACVAGLTSVGLLVCYILWENRFRRGRGTNNNDDDDDEDTPQRVYLQRPIFFYWSKRAPRRARGGPSVRRGGSEAYVALDAHARFHDEYGDDSRGEVAPLLLYVGYAFALILCVIDLGVITDLTLNNTTPTSGNSTAISLHSDSYGVTKVGSGISVLGGICAFVNVLYIALPPRRWYQFRAEAYLARRYY